MRKVQTKFFAVVNEFGEPYWDEKTGQCDIYTHRDLATAAARNMRSRGNDEAKTQAVEVSRVVRNA